MAHSFFGISRHTAAAGTFAVSANLFWRGNQVLTFSSGPDPVGTLNGFDWSGSISYGVPLGNNIAIGGSIGLVKININSTTYDIRGIHEMEIASAKAMKIDVGILFKKRIPKTTLKPPGLAVGKVIKKLTVSQQEGNLSLGMALLNIGPKFSFLDYPQAQTDHLPTKLMLGLAYRPVFSEAFGLVLVADFEKMLHESSALDCLHLGTEANLLSLLCLRAGYFLDTFGPKNSYLTFGGGIRTKYFSVNFARYARAILPSWHIDGTLSAAL